jgi:predicted dinucleotide-binding enzyme
MRIAVIGAGNVGRALGEGWRSTGNTVVYGVRDPGAERYGGLKHVATVPEALEGADVVVLAVPWMSAVEIAADHLKSNNGPVIVDATNALFGPKPDAPSVAAAIAVASGSDRVVKGFNTTGWENMADPEYPKGGRAMMPVAGDDPEAKRTVMDLAGQLGFEPIDAGELENAVLLESLTSLWIALARGRYGRNIAFSLLRR